MGNRNVARSLIAKESDPARVVVPQQRNPGTHARIELILDCLERSAPNLVADTHQRCAQRGRGNLQAVQVGGKFAETLPPPVNADALLGLVHQPFGQAERFDDRRVRVHLEQCPLSCLPRAGKANSGERFRQTLASNRSVSIREQSAIGGVRARLPAPVLHSQFCFAMSATSLVRYAQRSVNGNDGRRFEMRFNPSEDLRVIPK
jgi:hypothetical protein